MFSDALAEAALGRRHTAYDRSVDVHVSSLRRKLGDGLRRLMRGNKEAEPDPGRWERRAERFRIGFTAEGEKVVREGVRLAELRPEDDAESKNKQEKPAESGRTQS